MPRLTLGSRKWIGFNCAWAVGHVQEADVAEARQLVQAGLGGGGIRLGPAAQAHAGHRRGAEHLHEIAFGEAHESVVIRGQGVKVDGALLVDRRLRVEQQGHDMVDLRLAQDAQVTGTGMCEQAL